MCKVDKCGAPVFSGELCQKHYMEERGKQLGPCALCDRPQWAKGLCAPHYTRLNKYGDPLYEPPPRKPPKLPTRQEPRALQLMGEDMVEEVAPTYQAMHKRVYKQRGPARDHTCPCGEPAEQWAYDHQDPYELTEWRKTGPRAVVREVPYSTCLDHYVALCFGCHVKLDTPERPKSLGRAKLDRGSRKVRAELAPRVEAGGMSCCRCGEPIEPGTPWDLGHVDGTLKYAGPEHRACNRSSTLNTRPQVLMCWPRVTAPEIRAGSWTPQKGLSCATPECPRAAISKGLCKPCYMRKRRAELALKPCEVPECAGSLFASGKCREHYELAA